MTHFLSPDDAVISQHTDSLSRISSNNPSATSVQSTAVSSVKKPDIRFKFTRNDAALDDLPPEVASADILVSSERHINGF